MHLKRSFALLFALSLASVSFAAEVEDHMMAGSKFAQEKKYQDAAREFGIAVGLAPENADANLLLGLSLANAGDLDGAIAATLKAVQLRPNYTGYYNLGIVYSNQGKYDKAVEAYGQAVKANPQSFQAWHQLGKVHAITLDFPKAAEAYQKAAELNPKFADAYQGLASAQYWSGNVEAAQRQVATLKSLGFDGKASELERWIKDKEAKKKKSAKKAGVAPAPPAPPQPAS
jgi:tetratricopeptide (TPR) repeat protein